MKLRAGATDVLAMDAASVGVAVALGAKLNPVVVDDDAGTPEDVGRDGVLNENPPLPPLTLALLVKAVVDEVGLRLGMANVTFFGVVLTSLEDVVTGAFADPVPVRALEEKLNPPVEEDFGLSSDELVGVILKVGIDFGNCFSVPFTFPRIVI